MPINHSLYRPQERVITGYRSPATSNCGACRGGEWPLGVSIRSGAEKSCVSKRQCPLTDIYPPLSLLFLFSRFLSSPPIPPSFFSFLSGLERSLHTPAGISPENRFKAQTPGWVWEGPSLPFCLRSTFQVQQLLPAAGRRTRTRKSLLLWAVQRIRKEENSGDGRRDNEDFTCLGSSAVAATHFSGEFNVPLTFFTFLCDACVSSVLGAVILISITQNPRVIAQLISIFASDLTQFPRSSFIPSWINKCPQLKFRFFPS